MLRPIIPSGGTRLILKLGRVRAGFLVASRPTPVGRATHKRTQTVDNAKNTSKPFRAQTLTVS